MITYSEAGAGPAVVLVHGFLMNRSMWQPQLDFLAAEGFRAVAPDLRGFGDNEPERGTIPMSTHSEDLRDLLDALAVDEAVFVGYSLGGQVVMDFAGTHPGRVRGLVFSDTFSGLDTPEVRQGRLDLADRLESEGTHRYAGEFLPQVLSARTVESRPAVADRALALMRAGDGAGAAAALRGRAARQDYTPTVAGVTVPALVVAGREDVFDRGVLAAELAATLPGAELHLIDESGHTPSMETPDEFNAILGGFLRQFRS